MKINLALFTVCTHFFFVLVIACATPAAAQPPFQKITANVDFTHWDVINQPGFGNEDNSSVVAMAEYKNYLYAMTRNEVAGAELWRMPLDATGAWEQVTMYNDYTNGLYGNPFINNLWGSMTVFNGYLYCGFSSGLKGSILQSTGCEIWRYDGTDWEPIISDLTAINYEGTITAIADCDDNDAAPHAYFTDTGAAWLEDEWTGSVLRITSGPGRYRKFDIIGNTADTLSVRQNDMQSDDDTPEHTICDSAEYRNDFPPYTHVSAPVTAGNAYDILSGHTQSGFGDRWNKSITKLLVFEDKLYAATGLNSEYGAQVWVTDDGLDWQMTWPTNSFGNFHNEYKPVSSSISSLCAFTVSEQAAAECNDPGAAPAGIPVLYAGGTGLSGEKGNCARMARLTPDGWELIVDSEVDDNDYGTNENGFGDGGSMFTGNFIPWSIVSFNDMLIVGVQSLGGFRILNTRTACPADGAWFYTVGGDSGIPPGFDGRIVLNMGIKLYYTSAVNFAVHDGWLYAGGVSIYEPSVFVRENRMTGAYMLRSPDGITWSLVSDNGLGDPATVQFEALTSIQGHLYVSASKGCIDTACGLGGARILRLQSTTPPDDIDDTDDAFYPCPFLPIQDYNGNGRLDYFDIKYWLWKRYIRP